MQKPLPPPPPPKPPLQLRHDYAHDPPPRGFDARTFWKTLAFLGGVLFVGGVWASLATWFLYTYDWGILAVVAMFIGPLAVCFAACTAGWNLPLP